MEKLQKLSKAGSHEGYSESSHEVLERYFNKLNLCKEELKNKSVLDIGAGSGKFVEELKKDGITNDGLSLDRHIPEKINNQVNNNSFVVASGHMLPFVDDSFDYIVSVSAIPNITGFNKHIGVKTGESKNNIHVYSTTREELEHYNFEEKKFVVQIVRECLRVIKVGGEIRFGGMHTLRDLVRSGMSEALVDAGEMTREISSEGSELFILRKTNKISSNIVSDRQQHV